MSLFEIVAYGLSFVGFVAILWPVTRTAPLPPAPPKTHVLEIPRGSNLHTVCVHRSGTGAITRVEVRK